MRWRRFRTLIRRMLWILSFPLALLVGKLRSRHQVISSWPATLPQLGPQVVLFMHFDGKGNVRPQVLHYLREFKANGRDIVFITNSGRLRPEAMAALQEICRIVLIRKNIGYDFGAWADALEHLGLPQNNTEEVILANDSVFGPLISLSSVLRRLNYRHIDIWGLTESWQQCYHLQSFFLAFGAKALRAEGFKAFWQSVRPVPLKTYIVKRYEIGLTKAMAKAGLHCGALWPYEQLTAMVGKELKDGLEDGVFEKDQIDPVAKTRIAQLLLARKNMAQREPMNPTSDLWRQLLQAGFPFIKRELLRDNPSGVSDISEWAEIVHGALGVDPEPIRQELRLMLKGKAP